MVKNILTRFFNRLYSPFKQARTNQSRAALEEILRQHSGVRWILVFPPSLDWHMQLFQRPQQLALAFARRGGLVFYLQSASVPYRRGNRQKDKFHQVSERLYLCTVPLEVFNILKEPIFYILTWNWKSIRGFENARFIYDYVDEIEAFPGNLNQMTRDHEQLVRKATLVVTTAERLYKRVLPLRPDALLCPNGVDIEHFPQVRDQVGNPPVDLLPVLNMGKPVIGYYGALARWFDYALLKAVAGKRDDLSFVLIGPDYDRTISPSGLLRFKNVYWLGLKPYNQIPDYLRYFDVATIPFQLNEITHSTSPLKLFEYLAGGKPVVITAMQESMRYEGVLIANGADDFSAKIDQALQLRFDEEYLRRIEQVARQNTWDVRARQILEALD